MIFVDAEKGEVVGGGNGEGCLLVPCGEPDEAHFEVKVTSKIKKKRKNTFFVFCCIRL